MIQSTTFLAAWYTDPQVLIIIGAVVFSGGGWVVNQIRAAQAKYKAQQMQARAQMPTAARTVDAAERRRQQLQELAKRRQQQVQQANPNQPMHVNQQATTQREANVQHAQQHRQQQAQQAQRAQAQRAQAQRPQGQAQSRQPAQQPRPQMQRRQPQAAQQVNRPAPLSQPAPPVRQARSPQARPASPAAPTSAKAEKLITLTPIGESAQVLGVPLHKAMILKEILDKPVAMRDSREHPIGG
jgi:cell division protein FtsN